MDEVKPTYKRQTGKIKKKEGLSLAAKNRKVSSWLRNETRMKKYEREEKHSRRLEEETVLEGKFRPMGRGRQVKGICI